MLEDPALRHVRLKSRNMGVALVAACMLVLQGLVGAFALGSAAASPAFDAFGNPLCITSGDAGAHASHSPDHAALPECCTVACGMFAPVTADDRAPHSLANPLVPAPPSLRASFDSIGDASVVRRGPGSPRSPPLDV